MNAGWIVAAFAGALLVDHGDWRGGLIGLLAGAEAVRVIVKRIQEPQR